MGSEAWSPLDADDHERYWSGFEKDFQFRPSVRAEDWPAIREPAGSVTFDLDTLPTGHPSAEEALNGAVLRAFAEVVPATEPLVVLDWQHPGYHLWLSRIGAEPARALHNHPTPYPDGDYYIFLTEDLTHGTFGHPWEATICVFGDRLVPVLSPFLKRLARVKRTA